MHTDPTQEKFDPRRTNRSSVQNDEQEVKRQLKRLIVKYGGREKDVKRVEKWIYESDAYGSVAKGANTVLKKFFGLFTKKLPDAVVDELVKAFNDAWNTFPHRALNGKSPRKITEEMKREEKSPSRPQEPTIVCGGRKMSPKEYEDMLREMEKVQRPFKRWVYRSVLPSYERFLRQKLSNRTADAHFLVANIFFERVLHLGFPDFASIRRQFIQKEFPRWWTTHVIMDHRTPKQILSSLKKLFAFLEQRYEIDTVPFGFKPRGSSKTKP